MFPNLGSVRENFPKEGRESGETVDSIKDIFCYPYQYKWMALCVDMENDPTLIELVADNIKFLFLSKQKLVAKKDVSQKFKNLVLEYGIQHCLKAVSTMKDLTSIKLNQYKFMFRGFTLGKAVNLLLHESFYVYRNLLNKSKYPEFEFNRLVSSFIEFTMVIHKVDREPASLLSDAIKENIRLTIQSPDFKFQVKNEKAN